MNYFDKFDAKVSDALGQHPGAHLYSETVHANHVPADAVIVPDAQLLFGAEFKRTGVDLVLSGDGRQFVVHDYFKGEKHAPLASADGAHLTGDIVTALAGQVQYAQASGAASAGQVIGHVTKLVGSATAIRNGVSIILNNGDNVEKGDVVQSGSESTVGITFIDGTVFGLSSNARMVLNEMVYDPNGSSNSSLLSLVAGTITFVAGETAKHGDMKIDTPVATMGIRGTAVLVEIDFSVPGATPDAKFQVLVEPDGTTGSYILFDKTTLTPLAVVDKAGMQINISNGLMSQTTTPLSPEIQKLITDVFSLKFSDSSNTKSIEHFTDSIVPTTFGSVNFAQNNTLPTIPVIVTTTVTNPGTSSGGNGSTGAHHIGQAPSILQIDNGTVAAGITPADMASGQIKFFDINTTDQVTVSASVASATLKNADGQPVTLTSAQLAAVEAAITVSNYSGLDANGFGSATWHYNAADSAFDFLTSGETLVLTYTATVDNNYPPFDQIGTKTFTITITKAAGEVWAETTAITSPSPGDWYEGSNWKSGHAPTASDDTFIVTNPDAGTPVYPVVIKSAEDGGAAAFAKSLTMDDLGTTPPELDNYNTLTISNNLSLSADSILKNFGTISIGGLAEILQNSVLNNSGHLTLNGGGDFSGASSITNSGTLELAGGTLNVDVGVGNTGGTITVDGPAVLALNGVTITDGTLVNGGTLDSTGASTLLGVGINNTGTLESTSGTLTIEVGPTLTNSGTLEANGGELDISGEDVTNTGTLQAINNSILQLGLVTVNNTGGTVTVEKGSALHLVDAEIDHGVLGNSGTLASIGNSTLSDVGITNSGTMEVTGGTLTISDPAGPTVNNSGTLEANGGELDITTEPVTNTGTLQAIDASILKLTSTTVTNTDGIVHVELGSTLDFVGAAIDNGTLTNDGTFDSTGASTMSGVGITNTGTMESTGGVLTIDSAVSGPVLTNSGTLEANGGELDITSESVINTGNLEAVGNSTLKLTSLTVTNTSGTVTVASGSTLDLDGATVNGGKIGDAGVLSASGASEIENATVNGGGDISVSSGTLTLSEVTLDGVTLVGSFTNADTLTIDDTVTLNGATISGGTIDDTGTLKVTAASEIENATVNGGGDISVSSGTLTLSEVTLDDVTLVGSFTNADTLTIDDTVTLNGATISGGTIDDTGTLKVTAASEIENATVNGGGDISVSSGTLTLSEVTLDGVTLMGSFTNADTLTIDDTVTLNGATISGGTIDDTGTLKVTAASEIENATVDGGNLVATAAALTLSEVTLDDVTLVGSFTNADTLTIDDTVTLNGATISGGTIDDTGTLKVTAASEIENATVNGGGDISVSSGTLTLSEVTLDDVTLVGSFTNADTLTIDDTVTLNGATISGGTIDDTGTLKVTAASEIENATVNGGGDISVSSGTLTLSEVTLDDVTLMGSFTNADTLTIDDTVTLNGATISGGTIDDTGTLKVTAASEIENATVDGGNLVATAAVLTLSEVTLDDVTLVGSFTNADTLTIDDTVTLNGATISGGTIDDTGTLKVTAASEIENATVDGGNLVATAAALTLSEVTLDGVTLVGSFTNADTLTIDDTVTLNGAAISGGTIDDTGTIDVTGSSSISGTITVSPASIVDADLNGGNVTIEKGVTLTLDNVLVDGTIITGVDSATSIVQIDAGTALGFDSATITGGTLDLFGTLNSTGTSAIDGTAIVNSGNINVVNGMLTIDPTPITNSGKIEVDGNAALVLSDDVVTNSDGANNGTIQVDLNGLLTLDGTKIDTGIVKNLSGGTIDVTADSTISNTFSFVNSGTIKADGAALTLDNVSVNNSGGAINTIGSSGLLNLMSSTITRGKLSGNVATAAGNDRSILDGGTTPFTGLTLGIGSLVAATVGVLELTGNIFNFGEVDAGTGATIDLENTAFIGGKLGGPGTINTDGNVESVLNGVTIASGTIVKASAGILDLTGAIANNGEIDATTGQLRLENASITGGTLGGTGIIATGGPNFLSILKDVTIGTGAKVTAASGGLELTGTITNNGEIDSTNGLLELNNAAVTGGTLGGGGSIFTVGDSNELDNVTIAKGTTVDVSDSSTLKLADTITDIGTISLDAFSHSTELEISGNVSLTGGGDVTMSNNSHNVIDSDGAAATLTNHDTISGAGTIGDAYLTLVNDGTIDATGSHGLVIDTGINSSTSHGVVGSIEVTNNGTMEASGGSTLTIDDNVVNNGVIEADASNSHGNASVNITGNVSGDHGSIEILKGGQVEIGGAVSEGQTVSFGAPGGPVVTDGTLTLHDSKDFHGTIAGLAAGDAIDLADVAFGSKEHAVWTQSSIANGGSGTLKIYDGSGNLESTLDLAGIYTQGQFSLAKDASQGTDVHINNYISFADGTINDGGIYTPQISNGGSTIELTNGQNLEASSWFDNSVHSISGFSASFDYVATGGNNPADGMAFILQNSSAGVHALGGPGASLGYGEVLNDATAIAPSAAIELNLYALSGQGTAFAVNGGTGNYGPTGNVAFASGDQIQADISYSGNVLTETLTDLVTGAIYSAHYTVDLASVLGGNTAYVGFSAATGGFVSTQIVSNFNFNTPAASGAVIIDSHQTVAISASSSAAVNFANTNGTTGELLLADSKDFTGTIVGFAGDGTKANSDLIDIADVNFADVATGKTTYTDNGDGTGTLTLRNASGQTLESLKFEGHYQLANFIVENDGVGHTLIVDPPVDTKGQTPADTTVASNQNSGGTAADGFAFNFGPNHSPANDLHTEPQTFQPNGPILANLPAGSSNAPDPGYVPAGSDGHDQTGISGFVKAQLHSHDFHFV